RYVRDFADKRRVTANAQMNRLYVVESTPTVTGSMADHRLALGPREMEAFTQAVANGLGISSAKAEPPLSDRHNRWVQALIRDLRSHRGRCIVMAGDQQPPIIHALAHAMNQALGNV